MLEIQPLLKKRYAAMLLLATAVLIGMVAAISASKSTSALACYPPVHSVTATPQNDSNYTVKVAWGIMAGACSYDHLRIQWSLTSTKNTGVTAPKSPQYKVIPTSGGLTCGKVWNFWVVAEGSGNGNIGTPITAKATPPCPTVSFTMSHAGNTVTINWSSASKPVATTIKIYLSGGANTTYSESVATGSLKIAGVCHTSYSVYMVPSAGSQSGPKTATQTATTDACPAPPPPPPSGGSSHSSGSGGTASNPTVTAPKPPAAPTDFQAEVASDKIIKLSWTASVASVAVANYTIDRSTDNTNWTPLAAPTDTSYQDTDTDFSQTYYYRLRATDTNGNVSDYATATATTNKFAGSSTKVTSDDKLVTIEIPDGAFTQQTSCSLTTSASDVPNNPKQILLIGPYDFLCIAEDGSVVDSFEKPVSVSMDLSHASSGYKNFSIRELDDTTWSTVQSKYDAKARKVSFNLAAAKTFAAYGVKKKSVAGIILSVFEVLLGLGLVVGLGLFARRWWAGRATGVETTVDATQQFEQAVNKPACSHLSMAQRVQPQSSGCQECQQAGTHWKALRICLICGHVGCSDDSEQQHARKHFESTGHPLIYEYGNPAGDTIGWCYIDQTYI